MNRAGSAPGFWSRLPHSARTSSTRSAVTHSVSTPSRTSSDNPAHGCISSIMPTATCHRTIVRSPQATALARRKVGIDQLVAELAGWVEVAEQLPEVGQPVVQPAYDLRAGAEELSPVRPGPEGRQLGLDSGQHRDYCRNVVDPGEMERDAVLLVAGAHPQLIRGN